MAGKAKKKKKHTIAGRSLLYMILAGLAMIIGTCVAAGTRLFESNVALYQEFAYSYSNMIASNISSDEISRYLEMEQQLASDGKVDEKELADFQEKLVGEEGYMRINVLLLTSASYADLRYIYVVVPQEEDLIYVWHNIHLNPDAETFSQEELEDIERSYRPMQHVPYKENQKEAMKSVVDGTWDKSLFLSNDLARKQAFGTALSPIYDMEGKVVAVVGVDIDLFDMVIAITRMCLNIFLAISIILIVCMTIFYFVIRRRIIKPIVVLKKATADLVENLENSGTFEVNVHSGDEIEALARSFEEMDIRLKQYLQENMAITAERERLNTELDLARRIQADMLPSKFPAYPDRKEFDIYASMTPAKEVGGDFYDFFFIDENHLALVIADVSGKGIPAALFMMMSKIMLQNFALTGLSPKEVLEKVNDQICDNAEEMFVTVWLGVLDVRSGVMVTANAGHEYPMLEQPGAGFALVKDKHGLVLGGMEGVPYKECELKMEPGSRLFVYTDGVPEATDQENRLFGTDRTLEVLNQTSGYTPSQTLEAVDQAVSRFVGEAPQFDDLTMLCISYFGSAGAPVEKLPEEHAQK